PAPAVILARAVWPLHHAMASAGANIARAGRDATAAKHRGLLLRLIAAYVHAINRAAHRIPIAVPAVEARLLRRQPQRIGRVQRRAVDVGVAVQDCGLLGSTAASPAGSGVHQRPCSGLYSRIRKSYTPPPVEATMSWFMPVKLRSCAPPAPMVSS